MNTQEAERAWLNALSNTAALRPDEALRMADASRLTPDDFAGRAEADLFRAAVDFLRRGVALDIIAVDAALACSGAIKAAGGRTFLADVLLNPAPVVDSSAEYARMILDGSLRRRASALLQASLAAVSTPGTNAAEAVSTLAAKAQALAHQTPGLSTSEGDIIRLGEMLDAVQRGTRQLTVPSGIAALDAQIGGLQPGVLTMVGALPGVGKSSLLATIARNIANRGERVGFFSLEDERVWIARRLLALESLVPLFLIATRPLVGQQSERVEASGADVYETLRNIVIDDRQGLSPSEVAATARDMILNHGARVIIVDHLGEMRFARSERYDLDVADALTQLRDVAKRHNVPVVVASHVRRREGRGVEHAPTLTDFANSSAPERMARVALGLFKANGGDTLGVAVLKQTNGPSGHSFGLRMHKEAGMVDSAAEAVEVDQ